MSFFDALTQAISQSDHFSPAAKQTITDFLNQHRDVFLQLGQAATEEFFHALSLGSPESAYDALVAELDEPQLLDLIKQTGPEITAAIDRRTQILTHYRNFIDAVGDTALQLLAHFAISLL